MNLSERVKRIASLIIEAIGAYHSRFKRQRHFRGIRKSKYKKYYRKNRIKIKRKIRIYKKLRRGQLKRRSRLRHFHRR